MKPLQVLAILSTLGIPLASATHDSGCTVGEADPATYTMIDTVVDLDGDGLSEIFYIGGSGDSGLPRIPGSNLIFSNGSATYEENRAYFPDVDGSLQRGGVGLLGDWFPPGCDEAYDLQDDEGPAIADDPVGWVGRLNAPAPGQMPCLLVHEDPITDEVCGHLTFIDDLVL